MGALLDHVTAYYEALRNGRIPEVRAYHHSNERNRSGDLLGFDHAGRGRTTL